MQIEIELLTVEQLRALERVRWMLLEELTRQTDAARSAWCEAHNELREKLAAES